MIGPYSAPVHRALVEPMLLGGAPRALALANGTLAAALALGLRLWVLGAVVWFVAHVLSVWAARRDPQFVEVGRRHVRLPSRLEV